MVDITFLGSKPTACGLLCAQAVLCSGEARLRAASAEAPPDGTTRPALPAPLLLNQPFGLYYCAVEQISNEIRIGYSDVGLNGLLSSIGGEQRAFERRFSQG